MATCQTCEFVSMLKRQCRKNPPVVQVMGVGPEGPVIGTVFPSIKPEEDWCGMHLPNPAIATQ